MAPFRYGWIEPGNPEKRVAASIDRQFGADMSLEDVMLMRDIFAFVNQERNDTYNRHRELHIQEHEQSNVPFMIQDFEVDIEIPQGNSKDIFKSLMTNL